MQLLPQPSDGLLGGRSAPAHVGDDSAVRHRGHQFVIRSAR
jgi:hypothetical protein